EQAPAGVVPLSLHDALPISGALRCRRSGEILSVAGSASGRTDFHDLAGLGIDDHLTPLPVNIDVEDMRLRKLHRPELAGFLGKRSEEHTSELQSRENLVCRL